jgi:hypothetical protein
MNDSPYEPYALKPGFDYHLAEVSVAARPTGTWYQARCKACGFAGTMRLERGSAEDDCLAHDTTHNNGDE